jgi:hypothetical protein
MFKKKTELEKMSDDVQALMAKQADAVGMINRTIMALDTVNDELCTEISRNCVKVSEINKLNDNLVDIKYQNERLRSNFAKLLEV